MSHVPGGGEVVHGDFYERDEEQAAARAQVWEGPMVRTWTEVTEDKRGEIKSLALSTQRKLKEKLDKNIRAAASEREGVHGGKDGEGNTILQRAMVRFVYVVLDFSTAMAEHDLKPDRKTVMLEHIKGFLSEFYDENPISQIGFIIACNSVAYKVSELSGSVSFHMEQLKLKTQELEGGGHFSLQNALNVAKDSLSCAPAYGTREVLVVMGALATSDPGDIFVTLSALNREKIVVSVISMSAEMYVCRKATELTNGKYHVALDKDDFKRLLTAYVPPSPVTKEYQVARRWIKMGFSTLRKDPYPTFCECHMKMTYSGYVCPKCLSKYCDLPVDCKVCGFQLVSSSHLARSYHHLFPVKSYDMLSAKELREIAGPHHEATHILLLPSELGADTIAQRLHSALSFLSTKHATGVRALEDSSDEEEPVQHSSKKRRMDVDGSAEESKAEQELPKLTYISLTPGCLSPAEVVHMDQQDVGEDVAKSLRAVHEGGESARLTDVGDDASASKVPILVSLHMYSIHVKLVLLCS
jgi:transcription initiation factor TFIIH subunit 2